MALCRMIDAVHNEAALDEHEDEVNKGTVGRMAAEVDTRALEEDSKLLTFHSSTPICIQAQYHGK